MTYTVSITSQGQISIPAPLRRKILVGNPKRALVTEVEGKIVVEPILDLLDIKGSLKTRLKLPSGKVREEFGQYLAKKTI